MKISRYVELKLQEAIEFIKISDESSWSFIVRVEDRKICFAGELENLELEIVVQKFTEVLINLEFAIDEQHLEELITDLRQVKLFKFVNECVNEFIKIKKEIDAISKIPETNLNPQALNGQWNEGWALDLHTSSSTPIKDEEGNIIRWDTKRPPIAEELYRLKYHKEQYRVDNIAKPAAKFLSKYKNKWQIDMIIPIPPSDLTRDFQPVYEMAKSIGQITNLPVDFTTLKKVKSTSQLKEIDDSNMRREILKDAFSMDAGALNDKNILIFDDLYRSGDTLNAVYNVIMDKGKAKSVYILTITKTRSKK